MARLIGDRSEARVFKETTKAAQKNVARCATLNVATMTITRFNGGGGEPFSLPVAKRAEIFDVIMHLQDVKGLRLRNGESLVHDGAWARGELIIADRREQWRLEHLSAFDCLQFSIPLSAIRDFAAGVGRPQFTDLQCKLKTRDEVILGLAQALIPALEQPRLSSPLFLEQISLAVLTHLGQTYGGVHIPIRRKGALAPWQEKRATEFLSAHLGAQLSVTELAQACNLSRSYFIKAFKETFGKTPYRWLTEYRVAQAKDLLISGASIAEVANICGFSDQSHLTRVFSEVAGEPPGNWRRYNRIGTRSGTAQP